MATYKELHGINVQYRDSDATEIEGDVWYNAFTGKLKMYAAVGSWATGGNLNTGRGYAGGAGAQTAALAIGGYDGPGPTAYAVVESYDGSSWTEVGDLNDTKHSSSFGAAGTQTAAIEHGGDEPATATTETYDGSTWTEVGDLNVAVNNHAGANAGTSTATLSFAGGAPPPNVATNEEWNGTSWTEDADLNTARERLQGCGTSTAALCIDGATTPGPGAYPATESWNGTAWTEVNDTSTVHYWGAAWGSQTSAVVVGSYPAATHSDEWDGTSWAEAAVMPTSLILYNAGTGGPGASEGIVMGGSANSVVTQEWTLTASVETVAFD